MGTVQRLAGQKGGSGNAKRDGSALIAGLLGCIVLLGCSASIGSSTIEPAGALEPATIEVVVREPGRKPVQGALVKFGAVEASTDEHGKAQLSVRASGRLVGWASKPGFVEGAAIVSRVEDGKGRTEATLLRASEPQYFMAEQGVELRAGLAELKIPESAFETPQGHTVSGWIRATVTVVEPERITDVVLPVPLETAPLLQEPGGLPLPAGTLESYRMFDATFTTLEGVPVQLAPNKRVGVLAWLGASSSAREKADEGEVPLWSFVRDTGYWQKEGSCRVKQATGGRKYCEGEVSHFSYWNVDVSRPLDDCVQVRVQDAATKAPVTAATVLGRVVEIAIASGSDQTGTAGTVCIPVPRGYTFRFSAQKTGYTPSNEVITSGTGSMGKTCGTPMACAQVTLEMCKLGTVCGGCPAGQVKCGALCVDPNTNPTCCGPSRKTCGVNQMCMAGACVCIDAGYNACGSACVNLSNDAKHCGSCGRDCEAEVGAGAKCKASGCECPVGKKLCMVAGKKICTEIGTSLQHCQDCNTGCTSGETCQPGATAGAPGVCKSPWTTLEVRRGGMRQNPIPILRSVRAMGSETAAAAGQSRMEWFRYYQKTGDSAAHFHGEAVEVPMQTLSYDWFTGLSGSFFDESLLIARNAGRLRRFWKDPKDTSLGANWYNESEGTSTRHYQGIASIGPTKPGERSDYYVVAEDGHIGALQGFMWRALSEEACRTSKTSNPLRTVTAYRSGDSTWVTVAGDVSNAERFRFDKGVCREWSKLSITDKDGVQFTVRSILALSDREYIAVGSSGVVMSSSDGGASWTLNRSGGAELNSVSACRPLPGTTEPSLWAVGHKGLVVRSTDRGVTWLPEMPVPGLTASLYSASCFGDTLFVVGEVALKRSLKD